MKNNEIQGGLHKSVINWYPGHMVKTKKQITEDLKLIDIIVEILDARIPKSSQNPDFAKLIKDKPKIIILNKSDLAIDKETEKWVNYFEKYNIPAVMVNSNFGEGIPETIQKIEKIAKEIQMGYKAKGRIGKIVRVLVLGIPNVGKSSFINRMAKRSTTQVGNRPGVTRQKQWIRVNPYVELMDTPGVLWPKFEDKTVALNLSYTGTIKDEVLEKTDIAFNLLNFLLNEYKECIVNRYKVDLAKFETVMEEKKEQNEKVIDIMYEIGKKRGAIMAGGKIDLEKVANILLEDFRTGKLGRITLEKI